MDQRQYEAHFRLEERHWWFAGRREILLDRIDALSRQHPLGRVLDAGCGTGLMMQHLKRYGRVFGFDPDAAAVTFSKARETDPQHRNHIAQGALPEAIPFKGERFDLVTLLDVLEHIDDDVGALRAIRGFLRCDGFLLVTVPAYRFLWSGHDRINHHKRRYCKSELERLLKQAGFHTLTLTYFNTFLFLPILIVRLFSRWCGGDSPRSDLRLPPSLINRWLTRLFAFEKVLLRRTKLPFGVSLLAVAQKSE